MYGTTFNALLLHMYNVGILTQTQMLAYFPAETSTTLSNASAAQANAHND